MFVFVLSTFVTVVLVILGKYLISISISIIIIIIIIIIINTVQDSTLPVPYRTVHSSALHSTLAYCLAPGPWLRHH